MAETYCEWLASRAGHLYSQYTSMSPVAVRLISPCRWQHNAGAWQTCFVTLQSILATCRADTGPHGVIPLSPALNNLGQRNPLHSLTAYFFKLHFNIIVPKSCFPFSTYETSWHSQPWNRPSVTSMPLPLCYVNCSQHSTVRSYKCDAGIPSAANAACPRRQNCRFYCGDSEQSCVPQSLIRRRIIWCHNYRDSSFPLPN